MQTEKEIIKETWDKSAKNIETRKNNKTNIKK